MTVTVGRIVHYWPETDGACLAALVTAVHPSGHANLVVFTEAGDVLQRYGVDEADPGVVRGQLGGQWHWPEREA